MKVLHILRSEPNEITECLMKNMAEEKDSTIVSLHDGEVDWDKLVDDIFSHDRVTCWW